MNARCAAVWIVAFCLTVADAAAVDRPPAQPDFEAIYESLVAGGSKEGDDFFAYAAWLPTELFDLLALQAASGHQLEDVRDEILKSVSPHAIFVFAQAEKPGRNKLDWAPAEEIFRKIEITYVDLEGRARAFPKASRVKPLAQVAVAPVQRALAEAFGANASHFFFWYGDSPSPAISPLSRGKIVVRFQRPNGEDVNREIVLPLTAFVNHLETSPRTAAIVDNEAAEEPKIPAPSSGAQPTQAPNRQLADQYESRAMECLKRSEREQAIELIDRSLAARGGAQQVADSAVRIALAVKAKSLFELGRLDESEATLSFVHAEPLSPVVDPHRALADNMAWSTLLDIYLLRNDYKRAHRALLSVRQCKSADSHRDSVVVTQHKMTDGYKAARIYTGLNELDAAQKELDVAWDTYRSNFSADDATLRSFSVAYGELAEKRGDFAAAESRYAEAEQLAMKSEGPSSPARLRIMTCRHRVCTLAGKTKEVASIERQAADLVVSGFASTQALLGLLPKPPGQREVDRSLSVAGTSRLRCALAGAAMIVMFFLTYGSIGSFFRAVGGKLWWSATKLTATFCVMLFLNAGVVASGGPPFRLLDMPFALLFAWWAVRGITSAYKRTDAATASRYASPRLTAGLACLVISLVSGPLAFVANRAVSGGEPRYPTPFESEILSLGVPCLVAMGLVGLCCFLVGVGETASAAFSSRNT